MADQTHAASYRDVPVLVTGGAGFIGTWVTRALLAEGASVAVITRNPARLDPAIAPHVRVIRADVASPGSTAAAIAAWRPSITFNLIGYGVARSERDDVLARHVNVHVVGEAIEAIEDEIDDAWPGPRLVQAGSALEYGRIADELDETVQPLPMTTYGQTKLAATTILALARDEDRFPALTARLFTVFGPGERPGRLFPTLVAARGGADRIPLSAGTQARDFVYVEDAASALVRLGLVPAARLTSGEHPFDAPAINVASGRLTTVRAFATAAAKSLGIPEARLGFGDLPQLPEEMFHGPVPVARLRAAIEWAPTGDPASGLARAAAALRVPE